MKGTVTDLRGRYLLVALLAGVVSAYGTPLYAASPQATSPQPVKGDAEQQVRAAHEQLLAAARADDKETARRLMADELTWVTNTTGNVATKDELLASKPTPPPDVQVDQVRAFGNAAIVTGSGRMADGRELRFLQQWVNRDGQWQLFAHQGTLVAPAEASAMAAAKPEAAGTAGRAAMKGSAPSLGSDEARAVWKAQTDLHRAFLAGDTAAYSALTADDFTRIGASGERQGKSEFLQTVKKNAGGSPGHIETGDPQVLVSGDSARVVMETWGTIPGGQNMAPARVTRVFVKRNGQWQQAAAIFTPVAGAK